MINELGLDCVRFINGGVRCNCYCVVDHMLRYHHRDVSVSVSEHKGVAENLSECANTCRDFPPGKMDRCEPISDFIFIDGGITGQLPPLNYGRQQQLSGNK